ncbi:hypothetical protein TELCIR_02810 [Teladorsagia circumcincta]|uniref:ISXO2-like transposase domain-containing protein n=1 Tax=Teladorsagia circumcincta TaxID=45464 RepID=A0A2G9V056_TELCI|nr:hypothetical protein TELCIR_02810 [Teladorsagia circumcincta]
MFIEIVSNRDKQTLEEIILRHVLPGTTVWTDSWRGYRNLANIGYVHRTVNHSQNFVDPISGVHTQRIESAWSHIKRLIKKKNGLPGELWDDHFFEALWKWQRKDDTRLT